MTQQVPNQTEIVQTGQALWQKIAAFEMPSQADYVNYLSTMHLAAAILIFACGLVYLVHGWKIFKMLVVVNAALLGGFIGNELGGYLQGQNTPIFAAAAGALLFSVLAWPLMSLAVGLMGALAGSFLGYSMWSYVATAIGRPSVTEYSWAGAMIGLVTLGLLAFVVFRLVVMVFTSLQGSLMTASGIVAMLMYVDPLRPKLQSGLMQNSHLLVLLIGVPAVIGFGLQYSAMAKKARKKRKSAEEN